MTADKVFLVVCEAGEYSDYFTLVDSAWLTDGEARVRQLAVRAKSDSFNAAVETWHMTHEKLWDGFGAGPRKPQGWSWDTITVVGIPVAVPGTYGPREGIRHLTG